MSVATAAKPSPLTNPKSATARIALRRKCPACKADVGQWCVGISGTTMRGRRLTRLHYARCDFKDANL